MEKILKDRNTFLGVSGFFPWAEFGIGFELGIIME